MKIANKIRKLKTQEKDEAFNRLEIRTYLERKMSILLFDQKKRVYRHIEETLVNELG